jgi:prepilin signal peptidase PulO-like enzyme (type II secretory pathway)
LLIGVVIGLKPSGIFIAIAVFLIAVVTDGIGGGDVKLIAAVSVSLGLTNSLTMLFIACSSQLVFCFFLKLFTKKNSKTLPFVPFITFGYLIALLF